MKTYRFHLVFPSSLLCGTVLTLSLTLAGIAIRANALPLAPPEQSKAAVQAIHLPLTFEENRGQAEPEARFVAHSSMGRVLLTRDGAVLAANDGNDGAIRLRLVKARATEPQGESPTGGVANYYRTSNRKNWLTGIPMFAQVRYSGIYPGVDAVFHGHGDKLEYDFEVAAGRSPDAIGFHFEGADRVEVTNNGSLEIRKRGTRWELLPPVAYQMVKGKRREVRAGYRIVGNREIQFELGSYDHSARLVVDPVVQYAGILGAGTANFVQGIAVDGSGNLVLAGGANSGFPVVVFRAASDSRSNFVHSRHPVSAAVRGWSIAAADGHGHQHGRG